MSTSPAQSQAKPPRAATPRPFTKSTIDKLLREADPARDQRVYFANLPGLHVRLRRGRAAFVFEYRREGRVRRYPLGTYGEANADQPPQTVDGARALHGKVYRQVQEGRDPAAEREAERRRPKAATFAEAAELYLADLRDRAEKGSKRGRRSTAAEWARLLRARIVPQLGRVPVEAVDVHEVDALHRSLAATPPTANRALTVVSAVLSFAARRRMRPATNPCAAVVPFEETGRRERLTDDELVRLGEALRAIEADGGDGARAAVLGIRLIALTGMRRSEVFGAPNRARAGVVNGLTWGDVLLDDAHRCIRLRAAKGGAREVPLGRAVVALLEAARPVDVDPAAPVVMGRAGRAFVGVDKVRRAAFAAAGIAGAKDLHSLRHTYSSTALDLGVPELIVKALLGHALSGGETGRYLHPARSPLHQAADQVSLRISIQLERQEGEVLRFPEIVGR